MGVIVKATPGYDLGYVWKNQGAQPQRERSAGGYYINAAQAGEPPGRWWGPGAEALGFETGQVVEREPYELVYRQIDPRTGEKMGRSAGNYDQVGGLAGQAEGDRAARYGRAGAGAGAGGGPEDPAGPGLYRYDGLVQQVDQRVPCLHQGERAPGAAGGGGRGHGVLAGREAALPAGRPGGQRGGAGVRAALGRDDPDGVARGQGQRVEQGRFDEALITVTSWLQGTSRDGDPQDHIHNQIARIVETVSDGKHRALDTMVLAKILGAVQAVVATHAECGLTREFGVNWIPRADGKGNEIEGITQAQMDTYSSRTQAIDAALPDAVAAWERKYGRAPNQRELMFIANEVTLATRAHKEEGAIDWDASCAGWSAKWDAELSGDLASVAASVSKLRAHAGNAREEKDAQDTHAEVTQEDLTRATQRALVLVQEKQSTWTRSDLMKQIALVLPVETRHLPPAEAVALLEELTDRAIAGAVEPVRNLEAPEWPPVPGVPASLP